MTDVTQILTHWNLPVNRVQAFGPVWKISTPIGDFCLKSGKHGISRLLFDYHAIEWLWSNGFTKTPRFVPTASGAPFAETADGCYALQSWVGRTLDGDSPAEWLAAARELGRFHRASFGMQVPPDVKRPFFSGKWSKRFAERRSELQQAYHDLCPERNAFERETTAIADEVLGLATRAMTILQNSDYERLVEEIQVLPTLVHGNVKAENFTVDAAGDVHVIDFDSFRFDVSVQDLSDLLLGALPRQGWSFAFAQQLLTAYEEERPLAAEERPILLALMLFPYRPYTLLYKYRHTDRPVEKSLRKWRVATRDWPMQNEFLMKWETWLLNCVQ